MEYKLIKISRGLVGPCKDDWFCELYDVKGDRAGEGHEPNPLGFYIFPATMDPDTAFKKLKAAMGKARLDESARLQKEARQLMLMKWEEFE